MNTDEKKVVLTTRVPESIKAILTSEAELSNSNLSKLAEWVLINYCKELGGDGECPTTKLREALAKVSENNQEFLTKNAELEKKVESTKKLAEDNEGEFHEMWDSNNVLSKKLEDAQLKIETLEAQLKEDDSKVIQTNTFEATYKDILEKQLNYLSKLYPRYTKNQLIELAVACTCQNEDSWLIMYKLRHFLENNPNYFKAKSSN